MQILTLENKTFSLNNLPDEVDENTRFAVLDNSDPKEPDFFFMPLIFLESFNAPAMVLRIGEDEIAMPLDWSIAVGDSSAATDIEILPLTSLNDRGFEALIFNPLSSFRVEFKKIEIVSPYYSSGISLFEELTQTTNCSDISCSIPFENTDIVALDETLFVKVNELGIKWKGIKGMNETKGYRFNHSKIYQFLGEEKLFLLVGSINFTNMAWKGISQGGNYESAVLYELPAKEFESILVSHGPDRNDITLYKGEKQLQL